MLIFNRFVRGGLLVEAARIIGIWSVTVGLALTLGGCASHEPREHITSRPPPPPPFIAGPAGALLTGGAGFSARIALVNSLDPERKEALSGPLLGRGGWLAFSPETAKAERKRGRAAGFSFIWNPALGQGWLLCDALQGFAPISSGARFTNAAYTPSDKPSVEIDGRPCREEVATVSSSDGIAGVFRVWRSSELNAIPARVVPGANTPGTEFSLSQIRLEAPPARVFQPPDGFTKYESADVLMNELLIREGGGRRVPESDLDDSGVNHIGPGGRRQP